MSLINTIYLRIDADGNIDSSKEPKFGYRKFVREGNEWKSVRTTKRQRKLGLTTVKAEAV